MDHSQATQMIQLLQSIDMHLQNVEKELQQIKSIEKGPRGTYQVFSPAELRRRKP